MRKIVFAGIAVATLAAVPAFAVQQAAPARTAQQQPLTRASVQSMVEARFARVDADKDGFVTKAEAEGVRKAVRERVEAKREKRADDAFARIDADKDGSISKAEWDARAERGPAARGERKAPQAALRRHRAAGFNGAGVPFGTAFFDRADSDKDGRVSLAEASAQPLAFFDRADADRNGTVTPEERRAAFKAFREQRKARPNG